MTVTDAHRQSTPIAARHLRIAIGIARHFNRLTHQRRRAAGAVELAEKPDRIPFIDHRLHGHCAISFF